MSVTLFSPFSLPLAICALTLLCFAQAAPSLLREASGSVERQRSAAQGGAWQLAAAGQSIEQGLRIGSGRALIVSGEGTALLASDSSLRIYQQEPDFQSGRVYISGNLKFYTQSAHLASQGKVRLDLSGPTRRIAVIAGEARLALGTRQLTLRSGQQYDFNSTKISAFTERNAWYESRFTGEGTARIEAINGPVELREGAQSVSGRPVSPVEPLRPGQQLLTGEGAWAEVGFTGGGFLRLQPRSALSVMSIETVTGEGGKPQREVSLKLLRGSAWNVVTRRQGGYQLSTPTITTAVRGTVFRVDDSGLVKVFDGQVALPSQADVTLSTGQQRAQGGTLGTLVTDDLDRANQALDAARAEATRLSLKLAPVQRQFALQGLSQPGARLKLELRGARGVQNLALSADAGGAFKLAQAAASVPEGRYTLSLSAARPAGTLTLVRALTIDRSAPQLKFSERRSGRVLLLRASVQDALSGRVLLRAEVDGVVYRRALDLEQPTTGSAAFDWLLPLPRPEAQLRLSAEDEAGNVGYATR